MSNIEERLEKIKNNVREFMENQANINDVGTKYMKSNQEDIENNTRILKELIGFLEIDNMYDTGLSDKLKKKEGDEK